MENIEQLKAELHNKNTQEILSYINNHYANQATFSTSLGLEDQVITHYIFSNNFNINVFTLDTGRLFNETYNTLSSTLNRYKKEIKIYFPQPSLVEPMMTKKGPFSFYESVENRKECCFIRKVEPLQRALKGNKIWITGLRSEQSDNRKNMSNVEWDEANKIIKIHPLLYWTWDEVKTEIKKHNIPYNPLHDKGFVSIGCSPCTRAIKEGEDFRAGRWWWEEKSNKECGLHK